LHWVRAVQNAGPPFVRPATTLAGI